MAQSQSRITKGRGTKKEAMQFKKNMKDKGIAVEIKGYSKEGKRLWEVK